MRGRDNRVRAILLTAVLVITGGLAIALWPTHFSSPALKSKEEKLSHVREMTSTEIKSRFDQGVALLNNKQYEAALKEFHRVLSLSPTLPEAHVNAGFALLGLKRYAIARDFFEGAIALRKDQVNAYYGLAEAFEGLNDLPSALGAMRTYIHLSSPSDPFRQKADAALREWESRKNDKPPIPVSH